MCAYIDPYDSEISPIRKRIDRGEEYRRKNTALWSAFDIERLPNAVFEEAEVVLIGDSRMRQISGGVYSERTYRFEGKNVLDFSFGGASLTEQIDVFYLNRHMED